VVERYRPAPVALDESAYTLADVGNVVRAQAADIILLGAAAVHQAGGGGRSGRHPGNLNSGDELADYLHLAASIPNMNIPIDSEYSDHTADIIKHRLVSEGSMPVPEEPGVGVTPMSTSSNATGWVRYTSPT
jgi:L-rhamnonate dehydratase